MAEIMIVYVDLVFLTNLAVDGTVLLATAKARRLKPKRSRIAAAAGFGAAYAAALFWADIPYLYSFGAKIIVSACMLLMTFGYGGPLVLLRNFGVFYTVNFVTLGGVIGLGTIFQSADSPWGAMTWTSEGGLVLDWRMQLVLFAVSFLLSIWLFHGSSEGKRKQLDTEALIWQVEIQVDGESWNVPALLDTGNRLYDPIGRIPVMVLEASVWKEKLPQGWADRLREEPADKLVSDLNDEDRERFAWIGRLRFVPYRGINGGSRMMMAVKPDVVMLSQEQAPARKVSRVLIGLDGGTLSSDGAYRAILHPEMIAAGEEMPVPSQPA